MTEAQLLALCRPGITSRFGDTVGRPSPHKGTDIATFIYPAGPGKVIAVVDNVPDNVNGLSASGAGNYIWILHADGWVSKYMHLDNNTIRVVYEQTVTASTPLAIMGNTGNSTGAHLHVQFELNGQWVHPSTVPALKAPASAKPITGGLTVGDAVKVKEGVKWIDGSNVAGFVMKKTMYVTSLDTVKGTAVISTSKGGAATGRIAVSGLSKI